jgi:hypothetical protein
MNQAPHWVFISNLIPECDRPRQSFLDELAINLLIRFPTPNPCSDLGSRADSSPGQEFSLAIQDLNGFSWCRISLLIQNGSRENPGMMVQDRLFATFF